jgi:hypothetical protein
VKVISFFLMSLFSIMLIALIPIGTVLFSANSTILKPYHTEAYLSQSGLYSNFKQMMRKKFTGGNINQKQSALERLQSNLVGLAFDKIITDDLVTRKMGQLQTSFWDYLTSKSETFLRVPIAELADITTKFPALKIGDYGDFNSLIGLKAAKMEEIKTDYRLYTKGIWVLYILVFVLAGVCAILSYILNISGKWLGISLIIGGALALLIWIPLSINPDKISFSKNMEDYRSGITNLIVDVRHDFLQCLTIVSVVVISLGILMMFMRNREQSPDTPQGNNDKITIL